MNKWPTRDDINNWRHQPFPNPKQKTQPTRSTVSIPIFCHQAPDGRGDRIVSRYTWIRMVERCEGHTSFEPCISLFCDYIMKQLFALKQPIVNHILNVRFLIIRNSTSQVWRSSYAYLCFRPSILTSAWNLLTNVSVAVNSGFVVVYQNDDWRWVHHRWARCLISPGSFHVLYRRTVPTCLFVSGFLLGVHRVSIPIGSHPVQCLFLSS